MTNRFDSDSKKKKNNCRRCGKDWISGRKCKTHRTIHCKIINGKEVEVSREEDTSDFDADTSSSEVSVTTVTCIQQACKKEELETLKTDHN